MARTRRRTTSRKRSRIKSDWVYRPNLWDNTGNLIDALGSYEPNSFAIPSGVENAKAKILYDSHNAVMPMVSPGANILGLPGAARPEAGNAVCLAVKGTLIFWPNTWTLNDTMTVGIRIARYEQDPGSRVISIDAAYNMWSTANDVQYTPATYANLKDWVYEKRWTWSFNSTVSTPHFNVPIFKRFRLRLKPMECLALYLEVESGSADILCQSWLSTLVADVGR